MISIWNIMIFDGEKGMVEIDIERLWAELFELEQFGKQDSGGISRPALSPADQSARQWFVDRLQSLGMKVEVDAICNVIGTLKSANPKTEKKVVIGSHLDSVLNGGLFDGPLGVLAALETARVIIENNVELPFDLEVISFCDEEGAYGPGTIGSRAMMGILPESDINVYKPGATTCFAEELKKIGLDPYNIHNAKRDPSQFLCSLEVHIEQGHAIEQNKKHIGIVISIPGLQRYRIEVKGEANHAGTTPMDMRKDALKRALPILNEFHGWVRKQSADMVGNIGQLELEPSSPNVIPAMCRFICEIRSNNKEDLLEVGKLLQNYAKENEYIDCTLFYDKDPTPLDAGLRETIKKAADKRDISWILLPSRAGHDAQSLAHFFPTGLIFVPCKNGISHNPAEWAEKDDVKRAATIILSSVLQLSE